MTVEEIKAELPKLTPAELFEFEIALKVAIAAKRSASENGATPRDGCCNQIEPV